MNPRRISLLKSGRADTIIEDKNIMEFYLAINQYKNNIKSCGCTETVDVAIGFSPKAENVKTMVRQFDTNLREMRISGDLQKILDKYGQSDWFNR